VHRRCPPGVYGADDLLGGDPFQVGAASQAVRMPELALDQRQRDPLWSNPTARPCRSWCGANRPLTPA
jgi:hypothetical protein